MEDMKILIPSTPDYANWLSEVMEAAQTKKGESSDLWDLIEWFEADQGITFEMFEKAMLRQDSGNIEKIFDSIHTNLLDALPCCNEGDITIPRKWYFEHIFTIFGRFLYWRNRNVDSLGDDIKSDLLEKLDEKNLINENVHSIIKEIKEHIENIADQFDDIIDEAMKAVHLRSIGIRKKTVTDLGIEAIEKLFK